MAQQITLAFGVDIDKDVVRRILGKHYRPETGSGGPSWLTFLGQAKDSLWSIDLFRCESLNLRNASGAGGYGPVHSPDHRIWHSPRNCRWTVTVLDVPASDSRASLAEVSQHGQRSVVSLPPMAGQPSSAGGDGNQDRTVRAATHPLVERLVGTLRSEQTWR